jgi:hypothetical protein
VSKLLIQLKANYPHKIREWFADEPGYRIDLQSGWQWNGRHDIRERTVNDALSAFYQVRPCDCKECMNRK